MFSTISPLNISILHTSNFMDLNRSDKQREKNAVSSPSQKTTSGDDFNAWVGGDPDLEEGVLDLSDHELEEDEEPFIKRIRISQIGFEGGSRSKAIIGKMFFKTKLCCKYRAGICPYITNCNFAHGIEELRRPPPNWQDIIALCEEQGGSTPEVSREENQIPSFTSTYETLGDSQRSYKGRHCKKLYTDEGCPYGENCTFLHDEQSRVRESVAISLSPAVCGGGGNGQNQKPSNWKTRICNKWETTGACPFGTKCHFAHGLQELHRYGGGLVEIIEGREQTISGVGVCETGGRIGCVIQKAPSQFQVIQKWKGPEKISRIYGDWIEE